MFDIDSSINILIIPTLLKFFGDNADVHSFLAEDGTTIKLGATKSHLVWYHGKYKSHFMHGSSQIPELYLYAVHLYFNAFCMHIHKLPGDKLHHAFSSAYYIDPNINAAVPTNIHVIPYK